MLLTNYTLIIQIRACESADLNGFLSSFFFISKNEARNGKLCEASTSLSLTMAFFNLKIQLTITFVGKAQQQVMDDLQKYELLPYCEFTGYVNHNIAVGYEKAADVLLLFTPSKPEFKYVIPGKVFEYMAVNKPVLCVAEGDNDSALIIKQANAGAIVSPKDKAGIKAAILNLYQAYQSGNITSVSSGYEKYERKAQTEVLANILNQLNK